MILELPPPSWVDPVWWEHYSPQIRRRDLTQAEWLESVATAYCLQRAEDSLTSAELEHQAAIIERLLEHQYLKITPLPGLMYESGIGWTRTDPV